MLRRSKIGLFLALLVFAAVSYVACKTPQSRESSLQSADVSVGRQVHRDMQREFSYSVRDLTYAGQRTGQTMNEDFKVRRSIIAIARTHYSLVSRYEAILDMILRTGGSNQQGSTIRVKTQSVQEVVDDLKTSIKLFSKVAQLDPYMIIENRDIQQLKTAIVEGLQLSNRILANLNTWGVANQQSTPPPVNIQESPNGPPGPSPFVHQQILPQQQQQQPQKPQQHPQHQMPQEFAQPVPPPIVVMNSMTTIFERMSNQQKVRDLGLISKVDFSKLVQANKDRSSGEFAAAILKPFLKGDLETLMKSDAGISEGFSIYQHTNMVLQIFHSQRRGYDVLYDSDIKMDLYYLMPAVLVLHDIGKPVAIYKGDKNLQHRFSTPIAEAVLTAMGYSSSEVKLAKKLIDNDIFGSAMKYAGTDRNRVSENLMTQVTKSLISQSEGTGLYPEQYTELQKLFYISDAASYPSLRQMVFTTTQSTLCSTQGLICGRNGLLETIGYWAEYYSSKKEMDKPLTPAALYRKRTQPAVVNQGPSIANQNGPSNPPVQVDQGNQGNQGSKGNQQGNPQVINPQPIAPPTQVQGQSPGMAVFIDDAPLAAPVAPKPPTTYPPIKQQHIKVNHDLPSPWFW